MNRPVIGITVDNKDNTVDSKQYQSSIGYSRCIAQCCGTAILLPHQTDRIDDYVALCDGFMLTGGVDPHTEAFGQPTHPKAKPMDPTRQAFELALLTALAQRPRIPVLGICLGMQLMALQAGGRLNQHLPDTLGEAAALHQKDNHHPIELTDTDSPLGQLVDQHAQAAQAGPTGSNDQDDQLGQDRLVVSWHSQAVEDAGRLRVIAKAPDGVIESIDDPDRAFYLGVQWHPERAARDCAASLNHHLLLLFVSSCRPARESP